MKKRPAYLDKHKAYKQEFGIDITEQSGKNFSALTKRLKDRDLLPKKEQENYGEGMLSEKEEVFFKFWKQTLCPLFTAKHGTPEIKKIKKFLSPVDDRRKENKSYKTGRTGGKSRQMFNFAVLGIGDEHPVPVSDDGHVIKINLADITKEHQQILEGAFIGGHLTDYHSSYVYPTYAFGDTTFTVKYDKKTKTKTTIFERNDGTKIVENLQFKDEIIAAIPNFNNILEFLGFKFIEYLRFIGGDFQEDILTRKDISKIKACFHTLFPSHRFPELKIPSKVPVNVSFVEIVKPNTEKYTSSYDLHRAVMKGDLDTVKKLVLEEGVDVHLPNGDGESPFKALISNLSKYKGLRIKSIRGKPIYENGELVSCTPTQYIKKGAPLIDMLRFLLSQNVSLNSGYYLKTPLCQSISSGSEEIIKAIQEGSANPLCPTIRELPSINYTVMSFLIERGDLELFEKYFPVYCDNYEAEDLLFAILNSINAKKPNKSHLSMLEQSLDISDPNHRDRKLTLLMKASMAGKTEAVRILLQTPDIDINAKIETEGGKVHEYEGSTALHLAVCKQHIECVKLLVEAKAEIDSVDACGRTPHHIGKLILSGEISSLSKETQWQMQQAEMMMNIMMKGMLNLDEKNEKSTSDNTNPELEEILNFLEKNGASTEHKDPIEIPQSRNFAVAGLVKTKHNSKSYILLVRKPNFFGDPKGRYMLPGGIKDAEDKDYCQAGIREINEETKIDLTDAKSSLAYEYSEEIMGTEYRREIYQFELPDCKKLPTPFPSSDVASAEWVGIEDLEFFEDEDKLPGCSYNGIPLRMDNTIILQKVFFNKEIDKPKMNESLSTEVLLPVLEQGFIKIIQAYDKGEQNNNTTEKLKQGLEKLIKHGMLEADQLILQARPLIVWASARGHGAMIDWLVKIGSDINLIVSDLMGGVFTPLMALISGEHFGLAKKVIEEHDVDVGYYAGYSSALHIAARIPTCDIDFFKYLLSKVDNPSVELIGSCFLAAVTNKNISFALELLEQFSFNLNRTYSAQGNFGPSQFFPLASACQFANPKLIKAMLEKGASPMVQPSSGFKNIIKWVEQLKDEQANKLRCAKIKYAPNQSQHIFDLFESVESETVESLQQKVADFDEVLKLLEAHMPQKVDTKTNEL